MKSILSSFRGSRGGSSLLAASLLALLQVGGARAQAPPVPPAFQAIYGTLNTYLSNFNTTLNAEPPSQTPTLNTANLKNADADAGPALVNPGTMSGVTMQVQAIKAMGAQAVMVEVGFPMLYEPFLTSQGQSYAQWVTFYQQVAALVRAAGMKLIVENDTLLVNDVQAGWNSAPFYATLDWTAYQQARAQTALTIAQTMRPDYLVVLEEPITEADDSGQSEANTPSGSASLLSTILASVQQSGVPGMKLGAGTGTSQQNSLAFIQEYVTMPLDFIDFHVYPINNNILPVTLQIVAAAAAAGKPVAMTECWLWKVADDELGVLSPDQVRGRDPFNFWPPLDALFIQAMQNLARHSQMLFMTPFSTEAFESYLPYDSATDDLTPAEMVSAWSAQSSQNLDQAMYTSTAISYYSSLVAPPDTVAPTTPPGVTGASSNANTAGLNWSASTDNVGVAGYYVLRNASVIASTATLYYQDSGLTQSTTYAYTIEAFDLAGNISVPSPSVSVTTKDVTAPTAPGGVVATAANCQKATLTWSASTDNVGVASYIVFWGMSPAALAQVGRTQSTTLSYTSYPLTCGTTYYYGVEAADSSGNVSAMSATVSVTTPMPPAAPASLSAIASAATKIVVTWSAVAGAGLPILNYHVYRGTTSSNLSQVAIDPQTGYTDTTVTAGTTYYYAVMAVDTGADQSALSATVSAATPMPPTAPTGLAATPISESKLSLTWSASSSGGAPIQNYRVYRGITSSNLSQVATVALTAYNDNSGSPATTYFYAVQAIDSGGDVSPMSATVSATTLGPPSAPTDLVATAPSKAQVSLTWAAGPSGMPLLTYNVFRGISPSSLGSLRVIAATQTSTIDGTVAPATTYYYAIQAKDMGGNISPMSAVVSVTTP
jgi:fibronectin type 3 domain-containing protein